MTRLRGAMCFCLTLLACNRETGTPAAAPQTPVGWFQEQAAAAGLNFVHESGHRVQFLMPENVCGGAALFDMDGDGDLDVYFVQGGPAEGPAEERPPNQLFRNNGDGTFTDVTAGSGSADRGYGMGVATGDYDGDGDLDLYVTNLGPNVLLRNDGDGHFTDVTDRASVGESRWSASAAFLDYDADGDLDLFVTNYINWSVATELECYNLSIAHLDYCPPEGYNAPTADTLYMNNGDGTFTDVSEVTGIADGMGTGLGVIAGDFTNDGFIDVFVANDGMMDRLWVNDGAGRFTDQGVLLGCAVDENGVPKAGMGVVAADYDSDGDLDLLVCNRRTESDSLYRNSDGAFIDATAEAGLAVTSRVFTRFGLGWIDFDNDGWLDLYEANGRVTIVDMAEPNLLFRGTANGRFEEVTPRGGTAQTLIAVSRAAAFGDIDNDGAVDVLVVNRDGAPYLLHNRAGRGGHWIMFRVLDERGSDAIGATVTMVAGNRSVMRGVRTAYSYLAANDPRVHVGLGEVVGVTDVVVRWVGGVRESFGGLPADAVHTLRRGEGDELQDAAGSRSSPAETR